jgi:hypothetical protein
LKVKCALPVCKYYLSMHMEELKKITKMLDVVAYNILDLNKIALK